MLSGDNVNNLLEEKFNQLNSVTKVDSLLITDNEGVITTHKASVGMKTFVNIDISSNDYMKQTMDGLQPVYSNGFTGIDGKYRIVITYPITSLEDGHYIGTVVANLPPLNFSRITEI